MKAVARFWAEGRGGTVNTAGDPLTTAALAGMRDRAFVSDTTAEIGPDEEDVVRLFFSMATQWQRDPMSGRRLGLDYGKITPTADLLRIADAPALFQDLRLMESEALRVFARAA